MITKVFKKSCVYIAVLLLVSVVFAVFAKNSLVKVTDNNIDNSIISCSLYSMESDCTYDFFAYRFEYTKSSCNTVAVVSVIESEYQYACTKSSVLVKQVIKNDNIKAGDIITVFEPNYFNYNRRTRQIDFCETVSGINIMKKDCDYLVFLNSRDYVDEYAETLEYPEFTTGDYLYSFRLNYEQDGVLDFDKVNTYAEYGEYELFCCESDTLKNYNKLKLNVLEEYNLA